MDNFPEIMGMMDAAKFLSVSRQTIDQLVRTGKLRHRKTSAGLIFLKSDLEALPPRRRPSKAPRRPKAKVKRS